MSDRETCNDECDVAFAELIPKVASHIVFSQAQRKNIEIKKIIVAEAGRAVRLVGREIGGFCRSANINTQANVCVYPIEPPDCWRVNLISHVKYHGCCLGAWRDDCRHPCPGSYRYDHKAGEITIGESVCQDERGALRVTARMIPSDKSCGMPQRIYDDYLEAIEFKLLELLYSQGAQQWHSATKAAINKREFKEVINDMRWIEFERERMEGPLIREQSEAWIESKSVA